MPLLGSTPDRTEVLFRALCAAALAVRNHVEELRAATQEPGRQDWLTVLRLFDRLAIAAYEEQASARDVGREAEWARGQANHLARTQHAPEIAHVLERIAEDIRGASDEEVFAQLEDIHRRGRELAGRMVAEWGTSEVKARWAACQPLRLELAPGAGLSGMRAVTRAGRLILQVADAERPRHSLLTYLCLDFQILHEYISHVLPVWDSSCGVFSEAYLFAAARWCYPTVSTSGANVILADEEVMARMRGERDLWSRRRQEIALAFCDRWVGRDRLTSLLLELAVDQCLAGKDKERLLAMFRSIWVRGDAWDTAKREKVRGILKAAPALAELHAELRNLLKADLLDFP